MYVQLLICWVFICSMSRLSRAGAVARVCELVTDPVSSYGGIALCGHRTVCVCDCARHIVVISGYMLYFLLKYIIYIYTYSCVLNAVCAWGVCKDVQLLLRSPKGQG